MRFTGRTREITTQGGAFTTNVLERLFTKYPKVKHKIFRLYPQYSLTAITEGLGFVKGVDGLAKSGGKSINGCYLEWELMGETTMAVNIVSGSTTGTAIGGNLSTFNICVDTDYFNPHDVCKLESGQLVYILSNGIQQATGRFIYTARLFSNNKSETINANIYLAAGRKISYSYNAMSEMSNNGYIKARKGSELHREYVTTFRHDFTISGHANMTEYEILDEPSGAKFWITHAERMMYDMIAFTKERILLEGRTTIDDNGVPLIFDPETNLPVYAGNGLEGQLDSSCKHSYNVLTKKMLKDVISEVVHRAGKSEGVDILLVTGTKGMRTFMDLMEDSLKIGDNVYATRSGNNVVVGGNFTKYIYGDSSITVSRNYVLDYKEDAVELDEEGYPLSSSKMYFIDRSKYDGEPNIQAFHQNGLVLAVNTIKGVGGLDGKSSGDVSSPVHATRKVAIGTIGLQVINPYSSLILEKVVV